MTFLGILIFAAGLLVMAVAVAPALCRKRPSLPPALQYPAYRAYWLGLLASVSGYQMFRAGLFWLIYVETSSPLSIGLVAVANAVPGIFFNLFGGVFADKLDKRLLVMCTQATNAFFIFILATLTITGQVQPWHIMVISFVAGAIEAFDTPARQALYPHLIDRKVMMSAVALNSIVWQSTRIVAPAVAGFIIDFVNTGVSFFVAGAGFLTMAVVLFFLRVPPIPMGSRGNPAQDILEGLKFIRQNSIFSILIGMTFFNTFFGMSYQVLMPVFARDILEQGARGQGLLLGAGGAGAMLITFWFGAQATVRRKGLMIIGGAVMFGALVISFGLTSQLFHSLALAMVIMFAMGICNSMYMISIQSSLQMMVPDRMRGRVMGFYGMTWSIMPLGGMQSTAIAAAIGSPMGAPIAVALGGLAVVAFALGPALANRKLRGLGDYLGPIVSNEAETKPEPSMSASGADN